MDNLSAIERPWLWFTLGPATIDRIDDALLAGATGIRHTFSFATPELHVERALLVAERASALGVTVCSVADLPGEKFRLATFPGETIRVRQDDRIRLGTAADLTAAVPVLPLQNRGILAGSRPGSKIVVGDGGVELCVEEVHEDSVTCVVLRAGQIEQNRGLTLVGGAAEPVSLTPSDLEMLHAVASAGVFDVVALSFAANPADLRLAGDVLRSAGCTAALLAKIETFAGVERIDELCAAADLLMAARGDLTLAIGPEKLYAAVARIASAAAHSGVPWILATQLLEGLEQFGYPTRAELTDVVGWLDRGAAGAMLSRETVFGTKPLESIRFLRTLLDAPRTW